MAEYLKYIDSEHWSKLRKLKLEINSRCEHCKSSMSLHVHHVFYRDYYSCAVNDLVVLCVRCHNDLHDALRKVRGKPSDYPLQHLRPLIDRYRSGELGRVKKEKKRKPSGAFDREVSRIITGFWNSDRRFCDLVKTRDLLTKIIDLRNGVSVSEVILTYDADPF